MESSEIMVVFNDASMNEYERVGEWGIRILLHDDDHGTFNPSSYFSLSTLRNNKSILTYFSSLT